MSAYTVYNNATGAIAFSGVTANGTESSMAGVGQSVLVGQALNAETQYVSGGAPAARTTVSASIDVTTIQADGTDAATITGIPTGWAYTISNGASGTTDGTSIVLTALEAGKFTIRFSLFPNKSVEFTINATATPL